jgi:exopolyphosphatase / guanosine-5'-triphosphate,3'-diphosphate pyrophosphatase
MLRSETQVEHREEKRLMENIIPRWEWRTFGQQFGAAQARFAALKAEKVQQSEEVYLLAAHSDANVKIRDGLLDIKLLEHVDSNGLEQWRPVSKERFPIMASAAASVRKALSLPESAANSGSLSLDQLLADVAPAGGAVHIVSVTKTRVRYVVEGCVSEVTDVVANGNKVRTIAIEDADAAKVIAAVRAMALDRYENTSYPRGLKMVIGLSGESARPTRRAVIDVGTNSVKFHIGEQNADGTWATVVDRAEVTRLGEGIDQTGAIALEAMERTAVAIAGMADEATRCAASSITAVGTMGLRTATNSAAFLELVRDRCNVAIEVISGEEEARLAYLAVRSGIALAEGSLVIFDSGGGSSQFTSGRGNQIDRQFSVNVGAVRYTERFGLAGKVSPGVLQEALDAIAADLHSLDHVAAPDALVGMGGAVTNIAAVMHGLAKYDPEVIQGSVIERAEIDRQIEQFRGLETEARRKVVGLQPKRAEVILAGTCIVRTIMNKLKCSSLTVSDRGLRHGLLLERFGGPLAPPG